MNRNHIYYHKHNQLRKWFLVMLLTLFVVNVFFPNGAVFATASAAPSPSMIRVVNNLLGTSDTVTMSGINPGDTMTVYFDQVTTTPLGTAVASTTSASVAVTQLGAAAGYVYVTLTSPSYSESRRIVKSYLAEPVSVAPAASLIKVANNPVGTPDTVTVNGLVQGDVVKVYATDTSTTVLSSASAAVGATSAIVQIMQLGTTDGSIFVTVTSAGKLESRRNEKFFDGEALTPAPLLSSIKVNNNLAGTSDTVVVSNLSPGDMVKVYADEISPTVLGSFVVVSGTTSASVPIAQLGISNAQVYVTVTSSPKLESKRVSMLYAEEPRTLSPAPSMIDIVNNTTGTADHVAISRIAAGDVVTVYADATTTSPLGSAAVASGATSANVAITQLGAPAGNIYVTLTAVGKTESLRVIKMLPAEDATNPPLPSDIVVINNASGTADSIFVKGLSGGDIVSVYATETATTPLNTANVPSGATSATVSVAQIGLSEGTIYVTVTKPPKAESKRTIKEYSNEQSSKAPASGNVQITNNVSGTSDTIVVKGLLSGDLVKVYLDETTPSLSGSATSNAGSATVSIAQIGAQAGFIYVTVTSMNQTESIRTVKGYPTEGISNAPDRSEIRVVNNAVGTQDTLTVSGRIVGDVIRVYADETTTTVLGTATVTSGTSAVAAMNQIGQNYGIVYVTVTQTPKIESTRTPKIYAAEPHTSAPSANQIQVTNRVGANDTVSVADLTAGDTVNVYADSTTASILSSGTVPTGSTSADLTITQLGVSDGFIYLTVTSPGKLESFRVKKILLAE